MVLQDRSGEAAGVERQIGTDGTVLIVGARSTNLPVSIREHARITVWDSTDPDATGNRPVPERTRVIICLRFISHQLFGKLQRFATKHHALILPGLNNTGEVKQLLRLAFHLDDEARPLPDPKILDVPATTVRTRGAVRRFVQAHGNVYVPVGREARRLFELAQAQGLQTTSDALKQMLYTLRKQTAAKAPAAFPERPAPPPVALTPALTQPALPLQTHVTEALRLIDDVASGLALVREAVQRVAQDDAQMRQTAASLRQFLEPFNLSQ